MAFRIMDPRFGTLLGMNKILIALAATVAVLGVSCEESSGSDNPGSTSSFGSPDHKFGPLMRGETKAQVRARFRDPDQVTQDAEHGESWVYVFGKDRFLRNKPFVSEQLIRVRVLRINFDREGRVIDWKAALVTTAAL
jgi:outer membrane protein assembly factor BamE (lipoprotein component of BamABCDE complex)